MSDMTKTTQRVRRSEDQLIQDLEARIASLKARAERTKITKDPALKHITAAIRSIDKARAETEDTATKTALDEARTTLGACLALNGGAVVPSNGSVVKRGTRGGGGSVDATALLTYVSSHPGQRGEQIASALGTDTKAMRPVMKRLIEERKVKTKGERRGMTYTAL
jgi:hypothetical protein